MIFKNKTNSWSHYVLLVILSIVAFTIVNTGKVDKFASDSFSSLLVSQTIISDGTIKLDKYDNISSYGYVIHPQNKHDYHFFPLGTSLSSIPFVFIAMKFFDMDMSDKSQEKFLQRKIAGITAVICIFLMFFIARIYLSPIQSITIAAVFWFGTSFVSTMATSLWSHNFASIYSLLSVFLTIQILKNKKNNYWFILSICLFLAYLTRPTLSLLSFAIIGALFVYDKKTSIKTAFSLGICLGLFVLFSYYEFGQLLPKYYMPKRLGDSQTWLAIYGNLLSPARGLFIFSPFILLVLFNININKIVFTKHRIMIFLLFWIIAHLYIVSSYPHWWGGFSFGARFMSDILPALFLWAVLFIKYGGLDSRYAQVLLVLTVVFAIFVNSYQAIYNKYTEMWNGEPNVDLNSKYIFDWEYPQFLHTKKRHFERIKDFNIELKANILKKASAQDIHGKVIEHSSIDVYFKGWSGPAAKQRWSLGDNSEVYFLIKDKATIEGNLKINIGTLGYQKITVSINDIILQDKAYNSYNTIIDVNFNPNILFEGKFNVIKFAYSNPHSPKNNKNDKRMLAMAIRSFVIK